MFRATTYVLSSRTLLYRYRHPADSQLACISRFAPNMKYKDPKERDTCLPQPPPPPPPPRDDRLFWGTMSLLMLAGGFAVYAKRSPEVRDWLSIQYPWFDDLIAIMYEENMTYKELAGQCGYQLKKFITDYFSEKPRQCSIDGSPVPSIKEPDTKAIELASKNGGTILTSKGDDEDAPDPCEKLPPPVLTKDVCEMQDCMKDLGDDAYHNYMTARDACNYYNKLVEGTMRDFDFHSMRKLRPAMDEREALVKKSLANAADATSRLDDLTRYIECGMQAPPEQLEQTKQLLKEYQDKIKTMEIQYQWENEKSSVFDTHLSLVEEVVEKYVTENQTMFLGLNYDTRKPTLHGDPDLLLHHTLRYAQKLKEELREGLAGMTDRVNRAIEVKDSECEPSKNADAIKKARQNAIQSRFAKRKAELDKEFKDRYDQQKADNDKYLKDMLKKQLDRHNEVLTMRLKQKESEMLSKFDKMVEDKVGVEKKKFTVELNEMSRKLQFVEDKLNARLKAEREARRSQELWTAGASLLAATKKGGPYVNVNKELNAIEKASGNEDKLVLTVLKAIPPSVREKGIVPESVLRDKYHVMERTALKVAMVEQEGGPLPVYWLSWLQWALLFMKISGIPQGEFDNPPKEPAKDLDTYDLLQRARFWIERGNLAAAVRYVSSLEGASRAAAASWHEAARSHLEARQAAEAVLAHAAALGLQYI